MPQAYETLYADHRDIPDYEALTVDDVAHALARRAHVIVPVGSVEQHGRHLPLGTDLYQAREIARRASHLLSTRGIPLLVGPAIPFGLRQYLGDCPQDLPGTINLRADTLRSLVTDICHELVRHGFRIIHLLGSHVENDPVLQLVAKEVGESTEASVVTLHPLNGTLAAFEPLLASCGVEGHGGEEETANMLAIAPDLVRLDRAAPAVPSPLPGDPPANDRPVFLGGAIGRFKLPPSRASMEGDGIIGDPRGATAETGERILDIVARWVAQAVHREWDIWASSPE